MPKPILKQGNSVRSLQSNEFSQKVLQRKRSGENAQMVESIINKSIQGFEDPNHSGKYLE